MSIERLAIIVQQFTVADFAETPFVEAGGPFEDMDPSHPVVQAHDPATGLTCALAHAAGQSPEQAGHEARYLLAKHVAEHARPAAPATDMSSFELAVTEHG